MILQLKNVMHKSASASRCSSVLFLVIFLNLVSCRSVQQASTIHINLGFKGLSKEKVPVSSKVVIRCASDNPVWFKNGELFATEATQRTNTIHLGKIRKTDAGLYACRTELGVWYNVTLSVFTPNDETGQDRIAAKDVERAVSQELDNDGAPQFIGAENFNRFVAQPTHQSVKLRCPADGHPRPTISWTRDGEPIKRNGPTRRRSWAIIMDDLSTSDSGRYECSVCNRYGCIEFTIKLQVIGDDLQPDNVEILSQLSDASANTASTYLDTTANSKRETSEFGQELGSVDNDDAFEAPTFVNVGKLPTTISKHSGEMIQLVCPAEGDSQQNITWTKDGHTVNDDAKLTDRPWAITVRSLVPNDAGQYTCHVCSNNNKQCLQFTTIVEVVDVQFEHNMRIESQIAEDDDDADDNDDFQDEDKAASDANEADHRTGDQTTEHKDIATPLGIPEFIRPNRFNRLVAKPSGNMVRLKCPAIGNPEPNITWTKDGEAISRSMGEVKIKNKGLLLEDLVPRDSGRYKCLVCNIYGCIDFTTRLDVKDRFPARPFVKEGYPKNITAMVESDVSFVCPTITDLGAHIQWAKYESYNDSDGIMPPNTTIYETDPDNPEEMKLNNITHADEGWYTCIAANSLGLSAAKAYLHVVDEMPSDPQLAPITSRSGVTVGVVMLLAAFIIIMVAIMVVQYRKIKHEKLMKHRAMETVHQWTKKIIIVKPAVDTTNPELMQIPIVKIEKQRTTLVQTSSNDPSPFNEYEFPLDSNWEFSRNQLSLGPTLGEGAFGRVVMAEAHGLAKNTSCLIVAVKMVKEGHTDTDMASLVREMEVMKMIGKHINIINLLGCCSQDGPLYVIVEYAPHGNLKDFLKKNRPTSEYEIGMISDTNRKEVLQKDLISFAYQVGRGMEYLASRRCIHRDLAARNVLVSDDYVVKIADFGLARDIQESEYYRKNTNGRLPIKWMAPESLRDKFYDTQSDVWSYGVLLWEIMTYGDQPYAQVFSSEHLYEFLREGCRMDKPLRCSLNIYMLMRQCWNWNPHERPTFTEIVENLDNILGATINEEYLDLGIPLLETPPSSSDEDDDDDNDSDTDTLRAQSLLGYHR